MDRISQKQRILEYLLTGETINARLALFKFNCSRLAARIADIRKMGYIIASEKVQVDKHTRVAQYRLIGRQAA